MVVVMLVAAVRGVRATMRDMVLVRVVVVMM